MRAWIAVEANKHKLYNIILTSQRGTLRQQPDLQEAGDIRTEIASNNLSCFLLMPVSCIFKHLQFALQDLCLSPCARIDGGNSMAILKHFFALITNCLHALFMMQSNACTDCNTTLKFHKSFAMTQLSKYECSANSNEFLFAELYIYSLIIFL